MRIIIHEALRNALLAAVALLPASLAEGRARAPALPMERIEDAEAAPSALIRAGDDLVGKVWIFYDADKVAVRYRIYDTSPLQNVGDDWTMLFKTGDSVDLQIGLNPEADPKRTAPAEGDIRVLMTRTQAGAIAAVYRYRVPDTEEPVIFASPTGRVDVDRVEKLEEAQLELEILEDGYVFAAAFTWASLAGKEFSPEPGAVLRGDFGVLFSDPDGAVTVERVYWSNRNTSTVADVPSEIRLHPDRWGEIILVEPEQEE